MVRRRFTATKRIRAALKAVLPHGVMVEVDDDLIIDLAGHRLQGGWLPQGFAREVRDAGEVDIVIGPHLSGRARKVAEELGIGWVDEQGGACLAAGNVVVVRPGTPVSEPDTPWTNATLQVVEAVLTGTPATVAAVAEAVGLSQATCSRALKVLTNDGLLAQEVARGPNSGRFVADARKLLGAYADAAAILISDAPTIRVSIDPRSLHRTLRRAAAPWNDADRRWALTGALAADLMAPMLTEPSPMMVLVEAHALTDLHLAASDGRLRTSDSGALIFRAFTGPGRLGVTHPSSSDDPLALWPRVYADLLTLGGVRITDAAAHLAEQMLNDSDYAGR